MRNYIAVLIGVLVLAWAPHVASQSAPEETPTLNVSIDRSALDSIASDIKPIVTLNGIQLSASETDEKDVYRTVVRPGIQTIKVLVPGYGADRREISLEEGATGTFSITLVPHLTGLGQYVDDFRVEWLESSRRNYLPTYSDVELRFVDAAGTIIPITALSDVRLSVEHRTAVSVPISDMFIVDQEGNIRLTDVAALHQMMVNYRANYSLGQHVGLNLTFRARDDESGFVYEATTEPFRLGGVQVSGRVVLGDNVPEDTSLSGINVRIGGEHVETDEIGSFKIAGVPAGEVLVTATIRTTVGARRRPSRLTYRATERLDLSGPAEIVITLGQIDSPSKSARVDLIAHDRMPMLDAMPQDIRLSAQPDLSIPVAARYRMLNLTQYSDLTAQGPDVAEAWQDCRKARADGWRVSSSSTCPEAILGTVVARRPVWSGPEPEASKIGEMHVVGDVWYVDQTSKHAALVFPEYNQRDWGYQTFGYAVTVLDLTSSRVAIRLPQSDAVGWLDIPGSFLADRDGGQRNRFLGFSPLEYCGEWFGRTHVYVEAVDEDSLTYRLPTPHDLWSIYDDTERPPQEAYETLSINWREAYSADRRLLIVPRAAKTC